MVEIKQREERALARFNALFHALIPVESLPKGLDQLNIELNNSRDDDTALDGQGTAPRKEREKLHIWRLLHDAMSTASGSLTGMIPLVDISPPLESVQRRHAFLRECIEACRDVIHASGGENGLSTASARAKQRLDWSLSMGDLTTRSRQIHDIYSECENELMKMKKIEVPRLSCGWDRVLGKHDLDDMIDGLLELEKGVDHVSAPQTIKTSSEESEHKGSIKNMIRALDPKKRSRSSIDQPSSSFEELCLAGDSGHVIWECLYFSIPSTWIDLMQQALAYCSKSLDWYTMSNRAIEFVLQLNFAHLDGTINLEEDVGDHNRNLLNECGAFCNMLIHQGINHIYDCNFVQYAQELKDSLAFLAGNGSAHPQCDAVRNTIITFSTLLPVSIMEIKSFNSTKNHSLICFSCCMQGSRQLVILDSQKQQQFYDILHQVHISVFQFHLPSHFHLINDKDASIKNFDCFFISIQDILNANEFVQDVAFFKFFDRVIVLESDPHQIGPILPILQASHDTGVSVCLIKPDTSSLSLKINSEHVVQPKAISGPQRDFVKHMQLEDESIVPNAPSDINVYLDTPVPDDGNRTVYHRNSDPDRVPGTLFQEHVVRDSKECDARYGLHNSPFSPQSRGDIFSGVNFEASQCVPESPMLDINAMPESFDANSISHHSIVFGNGTHALKEKYQHDIENHEKFGIFQENASVIPGPTFPTARSWMPQDGYFPLQVKPLEGMQIHCQVAPVINPHSNIYYMYSPYTTVHASPFPNNAAMDPRTTVQHSPIPMLESGRGHGAIWSPSISPSHLLRPSSGFGNESFQDMNASTPKKLWPPIMNTFNSFKHIEKMYDDMRASRPPKRRLRKGEKFRRFK